MRRPLFPAKEPSPARRSIGNGPLLTDVKDHVERLGLRERVTFIEGTRNPFKYLSRSQCFVLSSNFEGFPNVLLEALACGLPVISTDCMTGPRDLLAPGTIPAEHVAVEIQKYGILVPTGEPVALSEAMNLVLNDASLRAQLANGARERAADFEEDLVIREFEQIIDDAIRVRASD